MKMKKIIIIGVLFISLFSLVHFVAAESLSSAFSMESQATLSTDSPTILTTDLKIGTTDAKKEGQVSKLQSYLKNTGFFNTKVSGNFGPITKAAVKNFQKALKLPTTGYVGPLTRASIAAETYNKTSNGETATSAQGLLPTIGVVNNPVEPTIRNSTDTVTPPTNQCALVFNTTLNLGDSGYDVFKLQLFLKTKGLFEMTQGGSYGNFGASTQAALLAYQSANGISEGTPGETHAIFFGPVTRAYVNHQLCPTSTSYPYITSLSTSSGSSGSQLTIYGSGFTPTGNNVKFAGVGSSDNVSSSNGTSLTFAVPNIPSGVYPIHVTNTASGASNSVNFDVTSGTPPTNQCALVFNTTLNLGDSGYDVFKLQLFLKTKGLFEMTQGGSYGNFGASTQAALGIYQATVGINPPNGEFATTTREYVNNQLCPGTPLPSVTVLSPNGGEQFTVGGLMPISWTYNAIDPTNTWLAVMLLKNGDEIYNPLTVRLDGLNSSTFNWTIPSDTNNSGINNGGSDYKIRVRIYNSSTGQTRAVDDSNGTFSISAATSTGTVLPIRSGSTDTSEGANAIDALKNLVSQARNNNMTATISNSIDQLLNNLKNTLSFGNINTGQDSIYGVQLDESNPLSSTNYVDINNGTQNIPLIVFDVTVDPTASRIYANPTMRQLTFTSTITGTAPTGFHLYRGNTELRYQPYSPNPITFTNLDLQGGSGNLYSIKADLPANTANGSTAQGTASSVVMVNGNGTPINASGTAVGYPMHFYHATPQIVFSSADYFVIPNSNATTTYVQGNLHFTVTPYPGQAIVPTTNDFTMIMRNVNTGSSTVITNSHKGLTITPQPTNGLLGPQTYSFTLTGSVQNPTPGAYVIAITSASSTVQDANGNYVPIYQTWGLDNFRTSTIVTH